MFYDVYYTSNIFEFIKEITSYFRKMFYKYYTEKAVYCLLASHLFDGYKLPIFDAILDGLFPKVT